jgi:formate dehydrogenase iron-sulfur subunit
LFETEVLVKALLFDATLCVGCKACEEACAERNKLPYDESIAAETRQSADKYTVVLERGEKFMRRLRMHCSNPTCVSVCPVAAFKKTADGPVVYDESRCMDCRYCMLACPFGVPKYEWDKALPGVRKCDMCSGRLAAGQPTAWAEIRPTGATKVGERDALIAEAQQRIRDNPHHYYSRRPIDPAFATSEGGSIARATSWRG